MLLTVTTRVKKHVSSVMDRLTKGGNLTDTTAAPEQSPFVGEMGGATTEAAVVIITTSFPYFGVKLSCVCLMIAYRKKCLKLPKGDLMLP